jgi:protein phosphatase 2C family protein 2/3
MSDGCLAVEHEWMRAATAAADVDGKDSGAGVVNYSGSVGVFAIIEGRQLYVGNVGDCRAVLCRGGQSIELTRDHTPDVASEAARVVTDGGTIEFGFVNAQIAVTRSFGDIDMATGRKMAGLIARPETHKLFLTTDDEFLILACDGLWDVLSSQAAVTFARLSLHEYNDVQKTAVSVVLMWRVMFCACSYVLWCCSFVSVYSSPPLPPLPPRSLIWSTPRWLATRRITSR